MKRVKTSGFDQMLHFDGKEEFVAFEEELKSKNILYEIEGVTELKDGYVNVKIKRQYNRSGFGDNK